MSSRLPTDEALEKEDRIEEIKRKKQTIYINIYIYIYNSSPIPHLLQAQQAPVLPYAKVVGRPGSGSYQAPSPDPTTHLIEIGIEMGNLRVSCRYRRPPDKT